MKRLSFLTALFGIGAAKAQIICDKITPSGNLICGGREMKLPPLNTVFTIGRSADHPRIEPQPGDRMRRVTAWYGKPANGECPVCGTMADTYKPEKVMGCAPPPEGPAFAVCHYTDLTPTYRRIDCEHCGVTFKQEAEK